MRKNQAHWYKNPPTLHIIACIILLILAFYTRFVNIGWGLPYPFHPDEYNIVRAIQSLSCETLSTECMHPHFFAYGQFPMYIAYAGLQVYAYTLGGGSALSLSEVTIALRTISAIASVIVVFIGIRIVHLLFPRSKKIGYTLFVGLVLIYNPGLIQFAHFGTTESLLMFFYLTLVWLSVRKFIDKSFSWTRYILYSGITMGFALGTKMSALVFAAVPVIVILSGFIVPSGMISLRNVWQHVHSHTKEIRHTIVQLLLFGLIMGIVALLVSPHNIIAFNHFMSSMRYESAIGTGDIIAFYTRSFQHTVPIIFQFTRVFPYVLGWGMVIASVIAFIFLPRTKEINVVRWACVIYFVAFAFLYAKWTRFMAPILPIMIILGTVGCISLFEYCASALKKHAHYAKVIVPGGMVVVLFVLIVPGVAFLSVYTTPDVRFKASQWIYNTVPSGSYILSETANVLDIPISSVHAQPQGKRYHVVSFDFYHLDENPSLQDDLISHIDNSDYIFVPSRRVFMNHTCYSSTLERHDPLSKRCVKLNEQYPRVNDYYDNLFSGQLGFELVETISSYPRIAVGGTTLISFPNEEAEETWTVFDHPVIRIFKRVE